MNATQMMMIVAYVRRSRRASVAAALRLEGLTAWSESSVEGHGRAAAGHGVPHTRFELIVEAQHTEASVEAIAQAAYTGQDGDGFITTVPVARAHRISGFSSSVASLS